MKIDKATWKAIEIGIGWWTLIRRFGVWRTIWGTDIFIGSIPMIKLMVLANVIMWALLWISR